MHVKFTAIVLGAYPGTAGRPKCAKKCAKMANFWIFGLNYWETVEDRWVHAAMRLTMTSIEFSFHIRVTYTAIVPGAYPGVAKMYLRLLRLRHRHTGVTLVR